METGTQEYYKTTVLQGFFDDNDREFLVEYFVREFKKAEKENYTANVFYNGCLKSLLEIKEKLASRFHARKRDIYWIINDLKTKIENTESDDESLALAEKLFSVQQELIELKESDFYFPVQLDTHPSFSKQFNTATIEFIESSIREAFLQTYEGSQVENNIDLSENKGTDKVIMLHKLGILDFLRAKEPFNLSTNRLASVLSGITGVEAKTLQSYINPIVSQTVVQKNNPLKNDKNVKKVTQTLIEIGFNPTLKS